MKNILFALSTAIVLAFPVRCQESVGLEAFAGKNIRPNYILSYGERKQIESVSYAPPLAENGSGERILAVTNYGWEGVTYDLNDTQLYASVSLAGPFLVEADNQGNPYLTQIFVQRKVGESHVFSPGWISPVKQTIRGVGEQDGDSVSYCSADKKRYVVVGYRPCPQDSPQGCPYFHAWYVDEDKGLRRELKSKEMYIAHKPPAPGNTVYCDGEYLYFTAQRTADKTEKSVLRGIWVYDLTDDKIYGFLTDPLVYKVKNNLRSYAQDPVAIPGTGYIFYLRVSWDETEGKFIRLSAKKKFVRPSAPLKK